ncbi:hypothetical protein Glove_461g24 [Diversispora epigaea]|uniref:Uncharacterized protein n=1 Tax=Diversispora epigaea TaxID=1348612 RepID=A0A397GTP2_9GLOM|nr:hypothetical protein Glove_461g24 [Diversispora epigaea]
MRREKRIANEILCRCLIQGKIELFMPPPISEVLIKQREGEKGKDIEEDEKIKESKKDRRNSSTSDGSVGSGGSGGSSSGPY